MFHAPISGRISPLDHPMLGTTAEDGNNGAWRLDSPEPGWGLFAICSDGEGWEHVSVRAYRSLALTERSRVPTWKEMCFVKDLCWDAEDVVVQYHPRKSEYVNQHPHVLHLWRPVGSTIPTPPPEFVGVLK